MQQTARSVCGVEWGIPHHGNWRDCAASWRRKTGTWVSWIFLFCRFYALCGHNCPSLPAPPVAALQFVFALISLLLELGSGSANMVPLLTDGFGGSVVGRRTEGREAAVEARRGAAGGAEEAACGDRASVPHRKGEGETPDVEFLVFSHVVFPPMLPREWHLASYLSGQM